MTDDSELDIAKAQLLAQLLSRVGYAVWQAAECEDTLAHYIVLHLRAAKGIGKAEGLKILEKAQNRTFGHLLKELREQGVLDPYLEERASGLLAERNWLVHRAKRESRGVLNDATRLNELIDRLDRIGKEAVRLNAILESELEEFVVNSGVDRSRIDSEAVRLQKSWGY
jgi:hypothetical protein